jgi:hypothetical protein
VWRVSRRRPFGQCVVGCDDASNCMLDFDAALQRTALAASNQLQDWEARNEAFLFRVKATLEAVLALPAK